VSRQTKTWSPKAASAEDAVVQKPGHQRSFVFAHKVNAAHFTGEEGITSKDNQGRPPGSRSK